MKFLTEGYEQAHGRKPRGYGAWAFGPEKNTALENPWMVWVYNATYSEAKVKARATYAALGALSGEVWVQS